MREEIIKKLEQDIIELLAQVKTLAEEIVIEFGDEEYIIPWGAFE